MITEEVLTQLKKGNIVAFDLLYNTFSPRVYRFSFKYFHSREEAEGIVQDVFISIWKYKDKINETKKFGPYLYTITYNAIKKRFLQLKKERHTSGVLSEELLLNLDDAALNTEYNNLHSIVLREVEKLPPRQKQIFILSREKGYSNHEIAQQLEISKKTVDNHLNSALNSVKGLLVKNGLLAILFHTLFIQ